VSNLEQERGKWGSKIGFIIAAAGSAIGLGNIWRFPYVAGENGGAAFVFIYIIFVVLIGLPVMIAELSIGRNTNKNPVGAFKKLFPKSYWKIVGGLGVLTGIGILSFYSVIAGWTAQYAVKSIVTPGYIEYSEEQGETLWQQFISDRNNKIAVISELNLLDDSNVDLADEELDSVWDDFLRSNAINSYKEKKIGQLHTDKIFTDFVGNSFLPILYLVIFLGLTSAVVIGGVSAGIERWSKILMPVLFVLLIVLAIRSVTLEGAGKGLEFYLKPDFSKITFTTLARALGQAFFSLSLGMGTMLTYGSYISKRDNLLTSASFVAFFDTLIAILAGLVMFPALFAMGMDPAGGAKLIFVVLPSIFAKMTGGMFFGAGIFILLSIAALTSTISVLEVPVAYFVDEKGWSRKKATLWMSIAAFVMGVPSAISFGAVSWFSVIPLIKIGFLDFMNALFGNYSLIIGSFFVAIFAGYKWGIKAVQNEIEQEGTIFKLYMLWAFLIRFICPVAIAAILGYIVITGNYF
jgi:NSS family neurotransmitter:Na+ symporter